MWQKGQKWQKRLKAVVEKVVEKEDSHNYWGEVGAEMRALTHSKIGKTVGGKNWQGLERREGLAKMGCGISF